MGMYNSADAGLKELTWTGFWVVWVGGLASIILGVTSLVWFFIWLVYSLTSGLS